MGTISPIDNILSRLDGVKETPKGWKARCPAHSDKNPSLAIAGGDDGRVLLKCWAGCEAPDIVKALGLELADLFERSYYRHPDKRQVPRPNWREVIQLLFHDATVIVLCSEKLLTKGSLTADDLACLKTSYQTISAIIDTTGALEISKRKMA